MDAFTLLHVDSAVRAEVQKCVDRIQAQDTELAHLAKSHQDACQASADANDCLAELQARQNELSLQLGQCKQTAIEALPVFKQSLQSDAALLEEASLFRL